jgi:hypothetical protein
MASDYQDLFDKWIDLLREQTTRSLEFSKGWLDALQSSAGRTTLRFRVPTNLVGDSGDQNNPLLSLPNVALGTITALVGFRNSSGNVISGTRLVVTEVPPGSNKFRFSLNNVAADSPTVGLYLGPVVNTKNSEPIAHVVIDVF